MSQICCYLEDETEIIYLSLKASQNRLMLFILKVSHHEQIFFNSIMSRHGKMLLIYKVSQHKLMLFILKAASHVLLFISKVSSHCYCSSTRCHVTDCCCSSSRCQFTSTKNCIHMVNKKSYS